MLLTGETVCHDGKKGCFREVRQRYFSTLNEAFEPSPMDLLRKAGHTIYAFEPEDGSPSDGLVVLADRHQIVARDMVG